MESTGGYAQLAGMAPGAELAAALHALQLDEVPNEWMLDVTRAQYRQLSHEQARMAATLLELGRCDGTGAGVTGWVSRSTTVDPWAVHETRAALRWTRTAAETEHATAEFVCLELPEVFAAWSAGTLDRPRVRIFEQYLAGLGPAQIAAVCEHAVARAPELTTGQLAVLLRRMVIAVDPQAADRWYRRRVRERAVSAYLGADGTVTISAHGLPPDEAEAACQRVQHLADAARRAGHPGTIDQIRADVFLGLLDGRFHAMTTDELVTALVHGHDAAPTDAPVAGPASEPGIESEPEPGPVAGPRPGPAPEPEPGPAPGPGPRPTPGPERDGGPVVPGPGPADPADVAPGRPAARPVDHRRGIEIRVALSTLLGLDDHPGEIPGLGPVLATTARARVAAQPRAQWRFAVLGDDPGHDGSGLLSEGLVRRRPTGTSRTGPPGGIVELHVSQRLLTRLPTDPAAAGAWAPVVAEVAERHRDHARHLVDLDADPAGRFPTTALRRHTEIRDRTCTFAGVCRRPAHASQQDHHHDHAHGGPNVRTNLGPACAQDHAIKHRAGWTVPTTDSGDTIWHSPLGGHYRARPEFLCTPLPEPTPRPELRPAGDPVDDHLDPPDGPILARPPPRPLAPPRPAPADEPPF